MGSVETDVCVVTITANKFVAAIHTQKNEHRLKVFKALGITTIELNCKRVVRWGDKMSGTCTLMRASVEPLLRMNFEKAWRYIQRQTDGQVRDTPQKFNSWQRVLRLDTALAKG